LSLVFHEYPKSIMRKVTGVPACTTVPFDLILDASSRDEAIDELIEHHLMSVMYEKPEAYIKYVSEICGVDLADGVFEDYLEIKATRDLLVHNRSEVNVVYLTKVGRRPVASWGILSLLIQDTSHIVSGFSHVSLESSSETRIRNSARSTRRQITRRTHRSRKFNNPRLWPRVVVEASCVSWSC
jgi:hypothetical protein